MVRTPAPALFRPGVAAALRHWQALQLAIEGGWGGPETREKADWLEEVIVELFENKGAQVDRMYLEGYLDDIVSVEFLLEVEDGSLEQVAARIVQMWKDCRKGSTADLEAFIARTPARAEVVMDPNSANDDQEGEMDEDDSELAAAPQLVPATADGVGAGLAAVSLDETGDGDDDDDGAAAAAEEDDGWTVVTPKKGGKKR